MIERVQDTVEHYLGDVDETCIVDNRNDMNLSFSCGRVQLDTWSLMRTS